MLLTYELCKTHFYEVGQRYSTTYNIRTSFLHLRCQYYALEVKLLDIMDCSHAECCYMFHSSNKVCIQLL